MANLIVCCDGTWNTRGQKDNGVPSPTNVVKIRSALAPTTTDGVEQKAYYRPGVGTSGNLWERVKGGAKGVGLDDDIKSAYYWLGSSYKEGDDIYMFGFSRGAFAVRSLAGMVAMCGLLKLEEIGTTEKQKWDAVDEAFAAYRALPPDAKWENTTRPRELDVKIRFLGVWDTVGALGIPDEFLLNRLAGRKKYLFHNTRLGPGVQCARHAISIDEKRRTFAPTLWTGDSLEGRDVEQVWFAGVHTDIGGGYAARGLGDITLKWMIDEATKKDLGIRQEAYAQLEPDMHGQLHESHTTTFYTWLKTRPRNVPKLTDVNSPVHLSAHNRVLNPPLVQPDYWKTRPMVPGGTHTISVSAKEHWNFTGLYLEEDVEYVFSATGEWLDWNIRCSPDGPSDEFNLAKLAYAAAIPGDWIQRRVRNKTGNEGATFRWARREHDFPWFSLVGVITNGMGVDETTQELCPHEVFLIGSSKTYKPKKSGYLYCFANDMWTTYWNNKGKVTLTVRQSLSDAPGMAPQSGVGDQPMV